MYLCLCADASEFACMYVYRDVSIMHVCICNQWKIMQQYTNEQISTMTNICFCKCMEGPRFVMHGISFLSFITGNTLYYSFKEDCAALEQTGMPRNVCGVMRRAYYVTAATSWG